MTNKINPAKDKMVDIQKKVPLQEIAKEAAQDIRSLNANVLSFFSMVRKYGHVEFSIDI